MVVSIRASAALAIGALLLSGCAENTLFPGGDLQTGALGPKIDPACVSLTSQIEGLRKEGVADKIEKAATKKYKMTAADLTKADQLTKASGEFQARCSSMPPKTAGQVAAPSGLNAPAQTNVSAAQAAQTYSQWRDPNATSP